ncbi:MAG: NADPH-dependent FMN reductase [Bacteroidia bacterium]
MFNIVIISGSVREGRQSHHVALYFEKYITEGKLANAEILDLKEFNFPIFEERLMYQKDPSDKAKLFGDKVKNADAVIIVSPEYNGSFPAALKNALDLLVKEWYRKPVGLVSVSGGGFGGVTTLAAMQTSLLKLKVIPTGTFPVPLVQDNFDAQGNAKDKAGADKRANVFIKDLLWFCEAVQGMKKSSESGHN